jgi:hypothetical protein
LPACFNIASDAKFSFRHRQMVGVGGSTIPISLCRSPMHVCDCSDQLGPAHHHPHASFALFKHWQRHAHLIFDTRAVLREEKAPAIREHDRASRPSGRGNLSRPGCAIAPRLNETTGKLPHKSV